MHPCEIFNPGGVALGTRLNLCEKSPIPRYNWFINLQPIFEYSSLYARPPTGASRNPVKRASYDPPKKALDPSGLL